MSEDNLDAEVQALLVTLPTATDDVLTEQYIALRDRKAEIKAELDVRTSRVQKLLDGIETEFLSRLNSREADSVKTKHGTAYKNLITSATLADAEIFRGYVFRPVAEQVVALMSRIPGYNAPTGEQGVQQVHDTLNNIIRWSIVDLRVGKKGVQESVENGGGVPPGVNFTQSYGVNIRRV